MKTYTNFNDYLNETTQLQSTQLLTESTGDNNLVTEFFFLARNCATQSHYLHLMTGSRSDHIALQLFYDGIVPLIDTFVESFGGKFGLMSKTLPTDIKYLTISEFRDWIETNRDKLTDCSELQNAIDEILTLCNTTQNQLENLK